MREVVIVEALRTAVGKRNGALALTHPTDILGQVQFAVIERSGLDDPRSIGQVIGGCIDQVGAQAGNVTRNAWLSQGGPIEVACSSVNSACGSSQHALNLAFGLVASGAEDIVLACGVENMSMVPLASDAFDGAAQGHGEPVTTRYRKHFEFIDQFESGERIALKYGITRRSSDELGLDSQLRARRALDSGWFDGQIVQIEAVASANGGTPTDTTVPFLVDELPRDTSMEALAALPPLVRPEAIHTAGTSSKIADGAAAVLLMTADRARELGLRPRARILQTCLVGCDPVLMLEGPIPATRRLLERQGMEIGDIDVIEINEAFSAIVLAWAREIKPDMERVNPNGGAIALGHALGATGCLLATKAVHELERSDGEFALVTMCCGGGLGTGTLLQRV